MDCTKCSIYKIHEKAKKNKSDMYASVGDYAIVIPKSHINNSLLVRPPACEKLETCDAANRIYLTVFAPYYHKGNELFIRTSFYLGNIEGVSRNTYNKKIKAAMNEALKEEVKILFEAGLSNGEQRSFKFKRVRFVEDLYATTIDDRFAYVEYGALSKRRSRSDALLVDRIEFRLECDIDRELYKLYTEHMEAGKSRFWYYGGDINTLIEDYNYLRKEVGLPENPFLAGAILLARLEGE